LESRPLGVQEKEVRRLLVRRTSASRAELVDILLPHEKESPTVVCTPNKKKKEIGGRIPGILEEGDWV